MGYHITVEEQNSAREESLSLEQRELATGHSQEAVQPASAMSTLRRKHCLPPLNQTAIVIILIVILVASSVLVALLTYWIAH